MNAIEFAATHELKLVPVGSRVTCVPPPTDTDRDYLVKVPEEDCKAIVFELMADGWELGGSCDPDGGGGDGWASFRKGEDNIILTWKFSFYDSFLFATEIAKGLNLLDKKDRITVFEIVQKNWE